MNTASHATALCLRLACFVSGCYACTCHLLCDRDHAPLLPCLQVSDISVSPNAAVQGRPHQQPPRRRRRRLCGAGEGVRLLPLPNEVRVCMV